PTRPQSPKESPKNYVALQRVTKICKGFSCLPQPDCCLTLTLLQIPTSSAPASSRQRYFPSAAPLYMEASFSTACRPPCSFAIRHLPSAILLLAGGWCRLGNLSRAV